MRGHGDSQVPRADSAPSAAPADPNGALVNGQLLDCGAIRTCDLAPAIESRIGRNRAAAFFLPSGNIDHDFPLCRTVDERFVGEFRGTEIEAARVDSRRKLAAFHQQAGFTQHLAVVRTIFAAQQRVQSENA